MKALSFPLLPLIVLGSTANLAQADNYDDMASALQQGKVNVDFRLRYESVDQSGINKNADALTLKSRFTAQSGRYNGWGVMAEVDNLTALIDNYNSTANGETSYPVVADPEGTDVNQFNVSYKNDGLLFTAGRQRINHQNQRFVGGVGWRQNEQTYDGYRVQYQMNQQLSFDYSYIFNVNRIFGPEGSKADLRGSLHLANVDYVINKEHKLNAFVYSLDFDTAASSSTNTYGVNYHGKFSTVWVDATYAKQQDNADNTADFSANYQQLSLGTQLENVKLSAGIEVLGSDNGVGFSTPLATLHKFQGFADKFLATPANGLQDIYVSANTSINGIGLTAIYHDFSADKGNADYGTELDLVASYKVNNHYDVLVKYATYNAGSFATDTDKLWLQLVAKF
jgi:hypothetical protein